MSAVDDLVTWLQQQLENQRFNGEGLKKLAFAFPPETGAFLVEMGDLLVAEVDAKRRILDEAASVARFARQDGTPVSTGMLNVAQTMVELIALPYADRPGYRDEWRP
ncbi:DUF6221 family protein [Micromonospora chalcea]